MNEGEGKMKINLVQRAKNMIFTPQAEWEVVSQESATTSGLYKGYIIPLAAIGPVAAFIGMTLVGVSVPFVGTMRMPVMTGLTSSIISYVLGLVGVFVLALIIDALAPTFGGEKNRMQALKVAAFSYTPAWVASILHIIPALGMLVILAGLYALYVLYLGLPKLMKAPQEKAIGYTITIVICSIIISVVIGAAAAMVGAGGYGAAVKSEPSADATLQQLQHLGEELGSAQSSSEQETQLEAMGQLIQELSQSSEEMKAAKESGDPDAEAEAMGEMFKDLARAARKAEAENQTEASQTQTTPDN